MRAAVLAGLVIAAFVGFAAAPASAYPWMISHGYTSCAACHVDPLGAGQLTAYGRGMDDLLVRWQLDSAEKEEPSPSSGFLFGLVTPPDWLNLGGNVRGGALAVDSPKFAGVVPLVMALDASATVAVSPFVAHASVGYAPRRAGLAVVISPDGGPDNALVSREHWVGVKLLEESLVFRAGRMPLPFGLRNNEHTSFVREVTKTDTNVGQQHGVAVAYANDFLRGEVMAVAGNYQVRPDEVRERGGAALVEIVPTTGLALGASSLVTYATRDIDLGVPRLRSADGVFVRWSPVEPLCVLVEADALVSSHDGFTHVGGVGFVQLDWAIVKGLHLMPAVEALDTGDPTSRPPSVGAWAGVAWYPLPHTELRFDVVAREAFVAPRAVPDLSAVMQLHLFL